MSLAPATSTAVSSDPLQTGKTNTTPNSQVAATYEAAPIVFFQPDTGEFIFVPESDLTPLENECRELETVVEDFHQRNRELDTLLERIRKQSTTPLQPADLGDADKQALKAAYDKAMEARKQLLGTLKPLGKLDAGRNSVVELIPVMVSGKPGSKGKPWIAGRKLTHVRSDKMKPHWRRYALREDQTQHGNKSVVKKDANGRTQIDKKALSDGLTTLKRKYKTEWIKVEETAVQGVLFGWAEAWNKKLSWDFAKQNPDAALAQNVDLSASAQMMRYLAGVGLSTEWDPMKGNCAIKASARAEFAIAEAKAAAALCLPDKIGWLWSLQGDDGKPYPLGAIRFKAELALTGAAGASIVAEGGLAIDYKDEKRKDVFGAKGAAIDASKNPNDQRGVVLNGNPVDPGASVELEAFAGAKADVKLVGSIQWLNPEEMVKDYQDFAKVGPAVAGLAGIGAGLSMELTYVAGKFRFKCMASVCLGLGAKGKLELEVDLNTIAQFVAWFFYQLYHANFTKLAFVSKKAFDALVQLQVLLIDGAVEGFKTLEEFVGKSEVTIREGFRKLLGALEREERRVQLMQRVNRQPNLLIHATPEAKGVVLYQLTRHDWRFDGLDSRNHRGGYYAERKRAIKAVLRTAHTKRDFDNLIQHMTPTGAKGNLAVNKQLILDFLDQSIFGDAKDDDEVRGYYDRLRVSLKDNPTPMFPVVLNDSPIYTVQRDSSKDHPVLAMMNTIELNSIC